MKKKTTPLIKQYEEIKAKHPDTVLLFRLGDFFETFNEDAVITARVCGLTLTKRNNGAAGEMPLAGFPHRQLDAYLPKLIRAGYRAAVCEQLEDPKQAKGIVKRGVIEVVSPGAALYDKLLDSKTNNFLAALTFMSGKGARLVGLAFADISTGEFFAGDIPQNSLHEALESIRPSEILFSKSQKKEVESFLQNMSYDPATTKLEKWIFDEEFGKEALLGRFGSQSLKGFGVEELGPGLASAGAVLHYVNETQDNKLEHIKSLAIYDPSEHMPLDRSTRRNLEISYSVDGTKEGSLIAILDKTVTAQGGRLLKNRISRPLRNLERIRERLSGVRAFFEAGELRAEFRETLSDVYDPERLITKISSGRAVPRDLVSMKISLRALPKLKSLLYRFDSDVLTRHADMIDELENLADLIDAALQDDPGSNVGSGAIFRSGYSDELDEYVEAKRSGKSWIADFRDRERETSGISTLKVAFNNVFGYYIEVTKTHKDKVPERYERKQTLTNSERYTTDELKEIEEKILAAEERIFEIESRLLAELKAKIAVRTEEIQLNAKAIASADCLAAFAEASREYDFTEPIIDESDVIEIEDGRHPVVERTLPVGKRFVPNSTSLDSDGEQIHIITGPNMSGKSCYLRQVALIVLLGQCGCFVPAKKARFGLVDRIFTRVGAQDNITLGESTFLVEMHEAANILNNATRKSLILLDEVGRGTATFDGISIAWAIAEYLRDKLGSKTLFATHYHELNELAERYDRVENYKVEVIETGGSVLFTHKVHKGASDRSFGIHVAKIAGLPEEVVFRADQIMQTFEESGSQVDGAVKTKKANAKKIKSKKMRHIPEQIKIFEFRDDTLRESLKRMDIESLTPIQALKVLSELIAEARKG